jgi:hypothetical protein
MLMQARATVNMVGEHTGVMRGPNSRPRRLRDGAQCDDSPGAPDSGWISAAIKPFEPGP